MRSVEGRHEAPLNLVTKAQKTKIAQAATPFRRFPNWPTTNITDRCTLTRPVIARSPISSHDPVPMLLDLPVHRVRGEVQVDTGTIN